MKPLLELIEDYGEACYEHGRLGVTYAGEDAYEKAGELLTEIRARLESMERDAARYAHIISRITQSELETVIRREHDDDGEYTTGLVQMIDAAMEAVK